MSYVDLESKIVADAWKDAPGRVAALEEDLQNLHAWDKSCDFNRELKYLERLVLSPGVRRQPNKGALSVRIKDVRAAAESLPPAPADQLGKGMSTYSANASGDTATASSLATFLRPSQGADIDEDRIRLLASEGQLADEICQFPVLSLPGRQTCMVLRSWEAADDEATLEHVAIMELRNLAVCVKEVAEMVAVKVDEQDEGIQQIAEQVADVRVNTTEAVVQLSDARKQQAASIMNAVAAVILGGGLVSVGAGVGAGACVLCIGGRLLLTGAALAATLGANSTVAQWQQSAMALMTEHLPRVFTPLLPDDIRMLRRAGIELEKRLIAKLEDRKSWSTTYLTAAGWLTWCTPFHRVSDVRKGGYACSTSWTVPCSAFEVFQVIQRLSVLGKLDPGCDVLWSRPVDTVRGTSVRYTIFTKNLLKNICRDFYCVCRCAKVETEHGGYAASASAGVLGAEVVAPERTGLGAEQAGNVQGSWTKGSISGTTLTWPSGGTIALELITPAKCRYSVNGKTYTAELGQDGDLCWSDGEVWNRVEMKATCICMLPGCDKPTFDGTPGYCRKGHRDQARKCCPTSGCTRVAYNGTPGQSCCRDCTKSQGTTHGPTCENKFQIMKAKGERYVFAVTSLLPEILVSSGLPEENAGIEHGKIYVCGILVSDNGDGTSLIQIMADVDACVSVPTCVSDDNVRWHVLTTATNLHKALPARSRASTV